MFNPNIIIYNIDLKLLSMNIYFINKTKKKNEINKNKKNIRNKKSKQFY